MFTVFKRGSQYKEKKNTCKNINLEVYKNVR